MYAIKNKPMSDKLCLFTSKVLVSFDCGKCLEFPTIQIFCGALIYGNKMLAVVHLVTRHVRLVMAPVRRSA